MADYCTKYSGSCPASICGCFWRKRGEHSGLLKRKKRQSKTPMCSYFFFFLKAKPCIKVAVSDHCLWRGWQAKATAINSLYLYKSLFPAPCSERSCKGLLSTWSRAGGRTFGLGRRERDEVPVSQTQRGAEPLRDPPGRGRQLRVLLSTGKERARCDTALSRAQGTAQPHTQPGTRILGSQHPAINGEAETPLTPQQLQSAPAEPAAATASSHWLGFRTRVRCPYLSSSEPN